MFHSIFIIISFKYSFRSKITLSSGKYARFTSGSVIATLGDTSVMTTVVRKNEPCNDSVIPLTVNYRQKASAIGRIPTNFLRREIGYTDHEILISRIIDRSVRPLFQPEYCYETQIVCNLLAIDGINNPDILSINAASAALSVSDIPWMGPIAAVRVGLIDNTYIINPTKRELQKSKLNLVLSSMSKSLIVMIEGSADDILEPELRKAIKIGVKECQIIIQSIKQLQNQVGKPKLEIKKGSELNNDVEEFVKNFAEHEIRKIFSCHSHDKISRDAAIFDLRDRMLKSITNRGTDFIKNALKALNKISKENFRSLIFETDIR